MADVTPADVYSLLNCISCEQSSLRLQADGLVCNRCQSRFAIDHGIPLMYPNSSVPSHLRYSGSQAADGTRALLRKLHLESIGRMGWRAYLKFDQVIAPSSPAGILHWIDKIQSFLPKGERTILDLGGGTGALRPHLARAADRYMILEVDPVSTAVIEHRSQHQYVIGDAHTNLFAECSFDVVSMFEVLEHVRNPFTIIQNCSRWLKPGGLLVVSAPQYWHVHGWPGDYFRYTNFGLREVARQAALVPMEVWPLGGPFILLWCMIELNFSGFFRFPGVRQLVAHPLLLGARLADWLFFRKNMERINPDTRGWAMVAQKPAVQPSS
jgi:2-polyprenyl-3-methyl-5-hydroxy-6-metoxy-1,4-benzoquinol methylase/uncharacterized protein YbaR (Trm112 family)